LTKNSKHKNDSFAYGNYRIYTRIKIEDPNNVDVKKMMEDLFNSLEENAKETYNKADGNLDTLDKILKTISFIKNRVFHIK